MAQFSSFPATAAVGRNNYVASATIDFAHPRLRRYGDYNPAKHGTQVTSRFFIRLLALLPLVATYCRIATADTSSSLSIEAFKNPPNSARPGAFWNWLNGNVDRDRLRYELQQMKDKGMSGAEVWDVAAVRNGESIPAGPEFLSPASVADIRFALDEGRKLGLRMGMITSSGWNAGGTWVDPTWASKVLVHSTTEVTGPLTFNSALPLPEAPKECPKGPDGKPLYYRDVSTLAIPFSANKVTTSPNNIVNLTDRVTTDGQLHWDVPPGAWQILRFGCTNTGQILIVPSPKSAGLFIDFLDPAATERHLQVILDRLGITPANAAQSGLNYLEVDSMELHEGSPWTDKFPSWFQQYRGYDLVQYLPILVGYTITDKDTSDRFLYDYRNTVSDLLIHSHYETGSRFLDKYGIEFVGEAGGPGPPVWNTCPVDALKALGNVHVPRGEFWIQHRNMFLIKEVASASHIYGKAIVDAESFTTWRRWEDSPAVLKLSADRAFAEGLNRLTFHGFAHSPESAGLPGRTYHAGADINPNTTWWPFARPFFDYLARCSYMLQQGRPVGDVLWYYGDKAPNFFPLFHNVPEKPRLPGLSHGYDYDVVNTDVILNRLGVKNGRWVLPEGTSYAVLAFPNDVTMSLAVLQKIDKLVREGGIVAGAPPSNVPGLRQYQEHTLQMREISKRLWDNTTGTKPNVYGKGKTYGPVALDDVLNSEGIIPDFTDTSAQPNSSIDFIHRTIADADIYFIRNPDDKPAKISRHFRVKGRVPHRWDPTDASIVQCDHFRETTSTTVVDLELDGGEATFIVFSGEIPHYSHGKPAAIAPFDVVASHGWTVTFPPASGAPTSVTLSSLKSWTKFDDPGIKYFSGIAEYRTSFSVSDSLAPTSKSLLLDLGSVKDVAEVELNGKPVGIAWKPPYQVDVTGALKSGENSLVIRVANMWHNRRVGDALLPESQRITKTNQPLPDKGKAKPLPSGLIGPIRIVSPRS